MLQARAEALGGRTGARLSAGRAISDRAQVVTATGLDSHALARKLRADADVEYAEVDQLRTWLAVPNDPLYGPAAGTSPSTGQWYLKAPVAPVLASISTHRAAWDITTGKTGIVVAVLDTGIRDDHPDLARPAADRLRHGARHHHRERRQRARQRPGRPGRLHHGGRRPHDQVHGCTVSDSSWHGMQVAGPGGRGLEQRHRHGRPRAGREGAARARARQVRRLRLRHRGRHALGRGPRGCGRARERQPGPRAQHEPRWRRGLHQRVFGRGERGDQRRCGRGGGRGQQLRPRGERAGQLRLGSSPSPACATSARRWASPTWAPR